MPDLSALLAEVRECRLCEPGLALGARPVLQCARGARILIAGQAPGRRVHASGIPFDDASGDRLRHWMGIENDRFYDPALVAILPMGFCYPGSSATGDLAPRPECAATWRQRILETLPCIELTLLLGRYAQDWHLRDGKRSLTERVRRWRGGWPEMLPLPHPSPRNNGWFGKNPWFEAEVVPELRARVEQLLQTRENQAHG